MRDQQESWDEPEDGTWGRPAQVTATPLRATGLVGATGPASWGDVRVSGVTHDSRRARPGDLYVALPGSRVHGARFADAAVGAGAVAVLTDGAGAAIIESAAVPVVVVDDPRAQLGPVAATVYGRPAQRLLMLGVTGTNGKTTTAYLVESCLRACGHRTGMIGTVGIRIGEEQLPTRHTTPEASDVHALLARMGEQGVTACVMEVSSHALALGRVNGVVFDVAGFTNLSQDHLDFHGDLERYFAAKSALFTPQRTHRAVVDVTGPYGRRLAEQVSLPTVTVASGAPADWQLERADDGVVLLGPGGEKLALPVALPGEFNRANAALAAVMALEAGLDPGAVVDGIAACAAVPGRMEPVTTSRPGVPTGIVDFAHTPEAIDAVLGSLRPAGQLIVVLGAGGDRDRGKRPAMGAAAARRADLVVVTDDNPRSEDPAAIRSAVLAGARSVAAAQVREVPDRRAAIRAALSSATGPADVVVVLGKGHEQGQEVAGVVQPFDDREVLRAELTRWSSEPAR